MPLFAEDNSPKTVPFRIRPPEHRPELAGEVEAVLPVSPAQRAGLLVGDLIFSVNGQPVEDVIDVHYFSAEEFCRLGVLRGKERFYLDVDKHIDESLGIVFKNDLFDGIRLCANRCDFCFVDQQPDGMRSTLKLRDDDYRLSFLHGNFVTLTNLTDHDWSRIFNQRLSPLYVTVHATDDQVRRRLLRNKRANPIMEEIHRLISGGIELHTQVVLCQGFNDGEVLDRTISDLADLYPAVQTLAVVPMGVTDYRLERNESQPYDRTGAMKVLRQIREHQRRIENRHGVRFVYPSDEFYILSDKPFPKAHTYQGFPQLSNGLGGCRLFLDEIRCLYRTGARESRNGRIQLVTGVLATGVMESFAECIRHLLGYDAQVVTAINKWYGESVTVAGLLTGRDIQSALNKAGRADLVLVPEVMLKDDSDIFLDDMSVSELEFATGKEILVTPNWPAEAFERLRKFG